jgi:hypothetical protein
VPQSAGLIAACLPPLSGMSTPVGRSASDLAAEADGFHSLVCGHGMGQYVQTGVGNYGKVAHPWPSCECEQ